MPLLDHFRAPIKHRLPWESICSMWIASVVRNLNRTLPRDAFIARATIHLGRQIEADVAEFEYHSRNGATSDAGGVAVAPRPEVEAAAATIAAVFPDAFEIEVLDRTEYDRVVGVIEFVSPSNKKEVAEREAFVAKCSAYLQRGIGLMVVDVVTDRRANLHNELLRLLGENSSDGRLPDEPLYAVGYRPVRRENCNLIDLWPKALALGEKLPSVPFPLKGGPTIALDLEATYAEAIADSGL